MQIQNYTKLMSVQAFHCVYTISIWSTGQGVDFWNSWKLILPHVRCCRMLKLPAAVYIGSDCLQSTEFKSQNTVGNVGWHFCSMYSVYGMSMFGFYCILHNSIISWSIEVSFGLRHASIRLFAREVNLPTCDFDRLHVSLHIHDPRCLYSPRSGSIDW